MKITFYGAAQTVTGSKYLIEVGDFKFLLDCGMHQGKRDVANELNEHFPIDAKKIDAVILSHAHADHCGMLPVLVREGFTGKIYCTSATADIAKFILEDAANIQENDALYFNKHLPEGQKPIEPLYTQQDVKRVGGHFEPVPYFRLSGQWTPLTPNIRFKFYDAGHILGSAVTLLEITENGEKRGLVFTGDLGRHFLPILRDPEYVQESAQTLITEATYGSRIHKPVADLEGELKTIITEAVKNKSKIIVPAFSLGRTQELLYVLHKMLDEKAIPVLSIYVDSPLSQKITRVFNTYTNDFDEEFWKDFGEKGDKALFFDGLVTTNSIEESKSINDKPGPYMVIAGSGMCEGGRVLHHLKNNIANPNNIVLITGYQAENTLGRKLIEKVSPVGIFGQPYEVKAKVITLNELSAHADQKDLLNYVDNVKDLKKIFLVHTEIPSAEAFKLVVTQAHPGLEVNIPALGESFEI
ncbi:MAG: MBL fold metallo-hydrolase [Candidatus Staskawiczbacteria bacterium]|nr:MBL fold metallo-hydrolase [Candidatus Staskawiczbacteria bacterium]